MKGIQGAQRGVRTNRSGGSRGVKCPQERIAGRREVGKWMQPPRKRQTRDALERFEELKADYPLTTQYRTFSNSTAFGRLSLA